jgi:3'-phosphoadenosine 5'-phosphosulfate sulfotransferase (PAPS reductase)/FAD synthetase
MTKEDLKTMQGWSLQRKIQVTQTRIIEFYERFEGKVYISFSGGKDSTVLLHIARSIYPNINACFIDTGLEYPEIRGFVKTIDNVEVIRPKISHKEVIEKYGYPVVSKEQSQFIYEARNTKSDKLKDIRLNGNQWGQGKISKKWRYLINAPFKISDKCCLIMKKRPAWQYEKANGVYPIIGTMACESSRRKVDWHRYGCNSFDQKRPSSKPLSFWLESDIWKYIKTNKVPYSKIYDMGYERTGCAFCLFGAHCDNFKRFELMKKTHNKMYTYIMYNLGVSEVIKFMSDKNRIRIDSYVVQEGKNE